MILEVFLVGSRRVELIILCNFELKLANSVLQSIEVILDETFHASSDRAF